MFGFLKELYRNKRYGPPIVVVSGLPRSGTSMMMKMLAAGGLEIVTDEIRTADEDNPKGYFEFEQVKELDKGGDKGWMKDCRGKVVKIISFLLKHLPEDNFYKVIFMRRSFEELIASQNKMLTRRGEPTDEAGDERMIQLYEKHLRKVDVMLADRSNFESLQVSYKAALDEPRAHAERVSSFLRRKLDLDGMAAVVDPELYRNRKAQ